MTLKHSHRTIVNTAKKLHQRYRHSEARALEKKGVLANYGTLIAFAELYSER